MQIIQDISLCRSSNIIQKNSLRNGRVRDVRVGLVESVCTNYRGDRVTYIKVTVGINSIKLSLIKIFTSVHWDWAGSYTGHPAKSSFTGVIK